MAAFALAAALIFPAAPAQAAEGGEPGELAQGWDWVWQWVAEVLTVEPPAGMESSCEHGSHIDPNG